MLKLSKRRRLPAREPLFAALTTGMALAHGALVLAQTVGPEIEVRDPSTGGSAFNVVARFEPGAAFVAWQDTRNDRTTTDIDIYVQKLGLDATPAWTSNGFPACVFSQQQRNPVVTPDGVGGCVVAWVDLRAAGATYIYAQRLSPAGDALWTPNGLQIGGTAWREQDTPALHRAPDGNFLATYGEVRLSLLTPTTSWIVAQKIDGTGQRLWGANGVDTVEGVRNLRSLPDGRGGLVVFGQIRDGPTGFRFQRVLADQSLAWAKPVDLPASLPFTALFDFANDGAGGVILSYLEGGVVRAVRVTGDGAMPWSESATTLAASNVVTSQRPVVASDGTGGVFVAWVSNSPHDIHVQHLDSNGVHLWPAGGAVVPDSSGTEREADLVADGDGGVFVSFDTSASLRGQRLDRSGAAQWKSNGSNGVSLMSGSDPIIGLGASGPTVVYARVSGLSVRTIDVPQSTSFHLTNIVFLPNNQVSLTLSGGVPGTAYDIFRASALGAALTNPSWTTVGTVRPGESWIDTSPPLPVAVYVAGKQTP